MSYRVIVTGTLDRGTNAKAAAISLASIFKRRPDEIEALFNGRRKVVKRGLTLLAARQRQQVFIQAGVHADIEPDSGPKHSASDGTNHTGTKATFLSRPPAGIQAPLSAEEQIDQAYDSLQKGRCPKCGAERNDLTIEQACPSCDTYPRKYLAMLEEKREREVQISHQRRLPSHMSAAHQQGAPDLVPVKVRRLAPWLFAIIAVIGLPLIGAGYSVSKLPKYEVLYDAEQAGVQCVDVAAEAPSEVVSDALSQVGLDELAKNCGVTGNCRARCRADYDFMLGNTGQQTQPQTVVRLDRALVEGAYSKPLFFNNDGSPRKVPRRDQDGVTSYALGPLKPSDQVVMRTAFLLEDRSDAPAWKDFLTEVRVANGEALPGPPQLPLGTRMYLQVSRLLSRPTAVETTANQFLDVVDGQGPAKTEGVDLDLAHTPSAFDYKGRHDYYDHYFTIRNHGTLEAGNVQATVRLANGFSLVDSQLSLEIDGGEKHAIVFMGLDKRGSSNPCRPSGDTLSCSIGTVRDNDIATLFLRLDYSPSLGLPEETTQPQGRHHLIELSVNEKPSHRLEFTDRVQDQR